MTKPDVKVGQIWKFYKDEFGKDHGEREHHKVMSIDIDSNTCALKMLDTNIPERMYEIGAICESYEFKYLFACAELCVYTDMYAELESILLNKKGI